VHKLTTEDIPNRVAADQAYQKARIKHEKAFARVITAALKYDTELFKQLQPRLSAPADGHGIWTDVLTARG
jgi:hypothetical protein